MRSWLAELTKGQFTKKSVEINLGTKGGKEIPISWTGSPMLDDERRIVGLVAVGRDLTERKRLEAQLIQSAKLTSLGVMAGGIAHEIRNPLAISSAAAQLLLERPDDEKFREEAAEKIHSGIQRASYIIENLLKFARPPEERMVAVDIGETLDETLSLLANQLRVYRIELWKEFAPALLPVVGNKSLLQQVFSNMILNACNAMPDGGSLTVATRATKAGVEIQFSDTGCGISSEHLPKIFDPFFTTMPVGKGIGLGLSISYSIIQQLQGTIEVESTVGEGTTFTVRLPADSK
jgi:signal transduction histidine kinase